ncbi:MAG TPA: hypothetical protein VM282_09335 [Acidimicrobiales bacterium]|nr:hypothetical protein [Acidimicrobiales bacterium]
MAYAGDVNSSGPTERAQGCAVGMEFGLTTVADAAQIPAARATIASARRTGFAGTVHAVLLGLDGEPSTLDAGAIDFLKVMTEPSRARQLAPLGFAALARAVVPSAILHALRTEATVVYVAPTVHLLAPLDDFAALADHRLALVDRPRAGAPDDGMHPTEIDLLRAGGYSPSIVAATRDATAALEWWRDNEMAALLHGQTNDLSRLFDRLAHRFGASTPAHPGRFADWYSLGVDLPRDDGAIVTVGGQPLVSVDLEGHDARHPHRLDANRPLPHRVSLSELPALANLVDARPDTPPVDDMPVLADGAPFDDIMRGAYRARLRESLERDTETPPNPYDDAAAFIAWLNASDFPGTSHVSRYLRQLYLTRPDLSRAFPEVPGRDTARFFAWVHDHGRVEARTPDQLLPPKNLEQRPRARVHPRTTAVNLVGFLDTALGIGEVARRIGSALDEAGIAHAKVPFTRDAKFDPRSAPYDINIVCINPDSLAHFANFAGESFFADRYTIGVWFWETAELPPGMAWAFDLVDEVWAASDFVADAIRIRAPSRVAVNVVTLPLVVPVVEKGFRPGELGLDEHAATFVTSWDYLSVVDRKNPLAAVVAYTDAFAPRGGTQLLLKGSNADRRPDDHQRIQFATRERPDIHLWTGQLTPERYASLLASATGVVSLHRSEGLALNLADAIALGVPTIATAYGGNLTFMSPADTDLVPYELVDVGPGQHPYPPDAQWADPDCAIAAQHMREIVADPSRARERAQRAQRRISFDFSVQRSAASVSRLLGAISQHDSPGTARRSLRRRFPRSSR